MLTIGQFANICKLTVKTLRYYSEIGLIQPDHINPKTGYRMYSVNQLENVLFINRLKSYNFSLEEIKSIIHSHADNDSLIEELVSKQNDFEKSIQDAANRIKQLQHDIDNLKQGNAIMSYLDSIDVILTEVPEMNILFKRKTIFKQDMIQEYQSSFNMLLNTITKEKLNVVSKPMVLFYSSEFTEDGLETEFAIQVKERITGTRGFEPGLCLKSIHKGSYAELSSVYTKLLRYTESEGYKITGPLFELYISDPSQVADESKLITEVYLPVRKVRDV